MLKISLRWASWIMWCCPLWLVRNTRTAPVTLERMHHAGLTVNTGKVQLASTRVKLQEHVMKNGTLQPTEDKLKAVFEYLPPNSEKSIRLCLGIHAFRHKCIPNYGQLSRPLNKLLRKGVRSYCQPKEAVFFDSKKCSLKRHVLLAET